jgi:hypothetical protein
MIALGVIGYSYACTNGGIHIYCYCKCDLAFTQATTSDNEIEKYVAEVSADITNNGHTINVYIINGYPCYEAYINYTIKNTGDYPIHFDNLTIINPNPEALEIATTNHTCTYLQPCTTVKGSTTVHILQEAEENWQYQFQIKIDVSCEPECYPHTIGFWKHQFSTALCKIKGKQHIPSTTLEHYLDQISSQSPIFEFTGDRKQKFQQALSLLDPPNHSNMKAKLKAQLLALWLNYVAGWTEGYTVEGMNAQQIIQGSENALLNNLTNKYGYWKNLCDRFNNLGGW